MAAVGPVGVVLAFPRAALLVLGVSRTPVMMMMGLVRARGTRDSERHQRGQGCLGCCSFVAVVVWKTLVEVRWRVRCCQRFRRGGLGCFAQLAG